MSSTSLDLETSVAIADAFPPFASIEATKLSSSSFRRAATTTLTPFAANASAVDLPMPLLAPVINATLFSMLLVFYNYLLLRSKLRAREQ